MIEEEEEEEEEEGRVGVGQRSATFDSCCPLPRGGLAPRDMTGGQRVPHSCTRCSAAENRTRVATRAPRTRRRAGCYHRGPPICPRKGHVAAILQLRLAAVNGQYRETAPLPVPPFILRTAWERHRDAAVLARGSVVADQQGKQGVASLRNPSLLPQLRTKGLLQNGLTEPRPRQAEQRPSRHGDTCSP